MTSSRRGKKRKGFSPFLRGRIGPALGLWALGCVALGSYGVGLPPFSFLFAGGTVSVPWVLGLLGFLLCCAAYYLGGNGSPRGPGADLSPVQARWGLFLVLALGAAFRLWRYQEPHPTWGYDPFWELMDARNSAELGRHALIFPLGGREPLFNYLLAAFWWTFPDASPYLVSRMVSVLLDGLAVWGLYLLGREVGGRRVGLLSAALGAASKPMMIMTLACTRGVAVTAAAAFLLFFTFRLFKRPDLVRFLLWGLVLGISAYTYTGIRPLWLFTVLAVLAYCWRADGAVPLGKGWRKWAIHGAAFFGGAALLLAFLKAHGTLGLGQGWLKVLGEPVLLGVLAALAVAGWVWLQWGAPRGGAALKGWFAGTALATALVFPLVLHSEFARHLTNDSIYSHHGQEAWGRLVGKACTLFTSLFLGGPGSVDRYDLNILGDAQLDLLSIPAVFLGFALALARPGWMWGWLLACGAVGILPLLASEDAHSVKLLAGLPALFTLAGFALARAWDWYRSVAPGRMSGSMGALFLVLLWIAALTTLHGRIWGPFAAQRDANLACAMEILQEPRGHRVYLAQVGDFFLPHQQNILLDGRDILTFRDINPIPLAVGESVPPVVIFFPGDDEYEEAKPVRERLAREFPGLPWREYSGPGWHRKLLRLVVPPEGVRARPDLFPIRPAEGTSWRRVFLRETYGLGRGGYVTLEERVPRPDHPAPSGPGLESCRMEGNLTVTREGIAEFSVKTRSWLTLSLDGREFLRHRPGPREEDFGSRARFRVEAGDHRLIVRLHRREEGMPGIQISLPVEGGTP